MWRIFRVALPRSWTGPPWFSDKVILLSVGALTLCLSLYVCSSCLVTVVVWVRPSWLLLSPPLPLRALLSPGAAQVSGFCSALPFPLGRFLLTSRPGHPPAIVLYIEDAFM